MQSNKLFGLITYDNLAMLLLFTLLLIMISKSVKITRENFQSIENDDLGQMLDDIDSLDFNQLQKFEKELKNKEIKDRETDPFRDIKGSNDGSQEYLPVDLDKSFDDLIDEEEDVDEETNFKYNVIDSETVSDEESELESQLRSGLLKSNETKKFKVGQLLAPKDISRIKDVIEDEQDLSIVGKTEQILAEDEAYKMIGNRKVLDQDDSSFLNKLINVRNGIDKIQSGVRKAKASKEIKKSLAKLNETELLKKNKKQGIFKGPKIDKLIDNSDKIFNKKLTIDSEEPDAIDEEEIPYDVIDEEVLKINQVDEEVNTMPSISDENIMASVSDENVMPLVSDENLMQVSDENIQSIISDEQVMPLNSSIDDNIIKFKKVKSKKLNNIVEDENSVEKVFDETRYKSITNVKSSNALPDIKFLDANNEEDLVYKNTVINEIESESEPEITDDDSESKYDKEFKNPVNTIPINDVYDDRRLVEDKEEQCRDGSCKVSKKPKKKSFQIDEKGLRDRLKSNVKSGTFIAPYYQDDISFAQAKVESKMFADQHKKLDNLRKTKKLSAPVPLSQIYAQNIPVPGIMKNPTGQKNLIQGGLDINKSFSNYYTINQTQTNSVERKIQGMPENSVNYSRI